MAAVCDTESPVQEYAKQKAAIRECAGRCQNLFVAVTESDVVFNQQQNGLLDLLRSADETWDKIFDCREGSSAQGKLCNHMNALMDAMKQNLHSQNSALQDVERNLGLLNEALHDYQHSISESRAEHNHVQAALESRVKSMQKMLKGFGEPKKKSKDKAAERRERSPDKKDKNLSKAHGSSSRTASPRSPRSRRES